MEHTGSREGCKPRRGKWSLVIDTKMERNRDETALLEEDEDITDCDSNKLSSQPNLLKKV